MERRLSAPKLSDSIAAELEQRILEGSWKVGARLPAERELSVQLGVSRASLREAIQKLVSKGLLTSRQGGGTYVTDRLESGLLGPWEDMLQTHESVREDLLEFRELLESKAAACAAQRATAQDKLLLRQCFDALDHAYLEGDLDQVVASDLAFHQAVAEASHNVIIGHLTASLLRLLEDNLRLNVAELLQVPEAREQLRHQHASIWAAIAAADEPTARRVAAEHVGYVRDTLAETLKLDARRETALRRAKARRA